MFVRVFVVVTGVTGVTVQMTMMIGLSDWFESLIESYPVLALLFHPLQHSLLGW